MVDIDALPKYRDLPLFEGTDERHAWDVFGDGDNLGTVNLLTQERIREAAKLVRTGKSFALDLPLDLPARPPAGEGRGGRASYVHHVTSNRGGRDDHLDNFYMQGSSQFDGLRNTRFQRFGYYQGLDENDLDTTDRLGMDHWGRHGIAGRGVLIDLPRYMGSAFSVHERIALNGTLIEAIAAKQNVELKPADILILRTGWMKWYLDHDETGRQDPESMNARVPTPGLGGDRDTAEWVWDRHIAAIGADNIALEALPVEGNSFQHRRLIAMFGMPYGELWHLEELADDCASDHVYEGFLVAKPLMLPRGVGSPPNVLMFK